MHLESGGCPSKMDIYDVNKSAARHPEWREYLDEDAQYRMVNRYHTWRDFPYHCPECPMKFERVSALVQHAEKNSACPVRVDEGVIEDLLRYIWERSRES